jgi:predicted deacetylase
MRVWQIVFQRELAAWARAGCTLSLWWRDDDARGPTPQLDRLLALSEQYDIPLTLAVIPSAESKELARRIRGVRGIATVQHGIDHINRAKANERGAQEMAAEWDAQEIAARLETTARYLRCIPNSYPLFVPPWHAVHPCLETALRTVGFKGWSLDQNIQRIGELVRIDTHVEVLRWKGGARFRGEGRFMRRLIRLARERRRARRWSEPIGILTHHLEQDEASWRFLERFIASTKASSAIEWRSLPSLLDRS